VDAAARLVAGIVGDEDVKVGGVEIIVRSHGDASQHSLAERRVRKTARFSVRAQRPAAARGWPAADRGSAPHA
jgi:hypothetical protein